MDLFKESVFEDLLTDFDSRFAQNSYCSTTTRQKSFNPMNREIFHLESDSMWKITTNIMRFYTQPFLYTLLSKTWIFLTRRIRYILDLGIQSFVQISNRVFEMIN